MSRSLVDIILDARNEQELYWAQLKLDVFLRPHIQPKSVKRIQDAIVARREAIKKTPPPQRPLLGDIPTHGYVPQTYPDPVDGCIGDTFETTT